MSSSMTSKYHAWAVPLSIAGWVSLPALPTLADAAGTDCVVSIAQVLRMYLDQTVWALRRKS